MGINTEYKSLFGVSTVERDRDGNVSDKVQWKSARGKSGGTPRGILQTKTYAPH